MNWWIHDYYQSGQIVELVSWIFWVLLSITLHELAHGWTAIWQGDDTPRRLGRLTMNPLVQMGPTSLVIFALCGIAWGAMPVDPSRFRDRRRGEIYVSAAGPAMNLAIAAVCCVVLIGWMALCPPSAGFYDGVKIFLLFGMALNLILCGLNLLPLPPLDGSRILAGFSWTASRLYAHPNAPLFSMFVFIAIFFMTPIGPTMMRAAFLGSRVVIDLAGMALGSPPF